MFILLFLLKNTNFKFLVIALFNGLFYFFNVIICVTTLLDGIAELFDERKQGFDNIININSFDF